MTAVVTVLTAFHDGVVVGGRRSMVFTTRRFIGIASHLKKIRVRFCRKGRRGIIIGSKEDPIEMMDE